MLYFISNWSQHVTCTVDERVLTIIRQFVETKKKHQVIMMNYLPFLRYKMQEYSIFSENFLCVFDFIQNIKIMSGSPLTIEDIKIPEDVEQVFHPQGITLFRNHSVFGEVYYNQFGFIEKIKYNKDTQISIDYYDDRGFLSATEYGEHEEAIYKKEYFNEYGDHTVTEYFGVQAKVIIESQGNPELKGNLYESMGQVITDVFAYYFSFINKKQDKVIVAFDEAIKPIIKKIHSKIKVILVISEESSFNQLEEREKVDNLNKIKNIVTDSTAQKTELEELKKRYQEIAHSNIRFIPIYNTKLLLGDSNSIAQLIIYFKVDEVSERNQSLFKQLINTLIKNNSYSLIVQVQNYLHQKKLFASQVKLIDEYFSIDSLSDEYKKVEKFIQAKKSMKLFESDEKAVEDLRKQPIWANLVAAVEAAERIKFLLTPSVNRIRNELYHSRIFIDINEKNDLKIQSLAVSTGIPMILNKKTDYLIHTKNGWFVEDLIETHVAVDYFLNSLRHWNISVITSIEIIKKNSSYQIMKKWRRVVDE